MRRLKALRSAGVPFAPASHSPKPFSSGLLEPEGALGVRLVEGIVGHERRVATEAAGELPPEGLGLRVEGRASCQSRRRPGPRSAASTVRPAAKIGAGQPHAGRVRVVEGTQQAARSPRRGAEVVGAADQEVAVAESATRRAAGERTRGRRQPRPSSTPDRPGGSGSSRLSAAGPRTPRGRASPRAPPPRGRGPEDRARRGVLRHAPGGDIACRLSRTPRDQLGHGLPHAVSGRRAPRAPPTCASCRSWS